MRYALCPMLSPRTSILSSHPNSNFRLFHFLLCLTFSHSQLPNFSFPLPHSLFRIPTSAFPTFCFFSPSHILTFSPSQLPNFSPSVHSPSHLLPPTFSPSHLLTFCPFPLPPFPPSALRLPTYDFFKSGYPPATPTLSTRSCRAGCCPGRNEYRPLRYAAAGG